MNVLASIRTFLGYGPKEGPKYINAQLPFSPTIGEVSFDVGKLAQDAVFSTFQSVWIDNVANGNPLILTMVGSNQKIRCPAYSQGMFPVIAAGNQKIIANTVPADLTVEIILLNVPVAAFVYSVS